MNPEQLKYAQEKLAEYQNIDSSYDFLNKIKGLKLPPTDAGFIEFEIIRAIAKIKELSRGHRYKEDFLSKHRFFQNITNKASNQGPLTIIDAFRGVNFNVIERLSNFFEHADHPRPLQPTLGIKSTGKRSRSSRSSDSSRSSGSRNKAGEPASQKRRTS